MRKSILSISLVCLALACGLPALGQQEPPEGPPKVLTIVREFLKPGKAGLAHEKAEAAFLRAFAKAKWPTHYVALASVTGPSEAIFLTHYDSFAAWEKDSKAADNNPTLSADLSRAGESDGELLSHVSEVVGLYREDLSYNPHVDVPKMRYLEMEWVRVRLGHEKDYQELVKLFKTTSDKVNTGEHWAAYEIVSGMPGQTLLFIVPRKSLADWDRLGDVYGKAFDEALGEDGQKKVRETLSSAVEKDESALFAFSPAMSYPPEEWIKADPDFWKPKPAAPKAAASATKKMKAEAKPAAKQ